MKVVVVGASSGLGRCIGVGLAKRGSKVALLGRRHERLVDAAREAGPDALAIVCDATDAASCSSAIEEAAAGLGGIEGLVYAPGIGPLARVESLDSETWHRAFDTNVVGASLITAAALPHLEASQGVAAYLSSVSSSVTSPWPGLAAYAVTKAALDKLVDSWRTEHPALGFTRITVGDCAGGRGDSMTEFNHGWDPELAAEIMPLWFEQGLSTGDLVRVDELVKLVDAVLGCGATGAIPSVTLTPRRKGGRTGTYAAQG
jgi:NAD(P)-dependent dehydrogenase (short-subunit alcohol dehydrogenase family)